ncbi:hypothetical protein V6N12_016117 [Hibiscus sabdariffa]|uniref:Uncharacterized protein n=1 Tax=Hibiscus sabdariffa TaxID=183260 RepID=A0ABR2C8R6_9ROSI
MDTSVLNFYPTLFVSIMDVLDMFGDMAWEHNMQKVEFVEDGAKFCSLRENFEASDVSVDAKETCYNWFCKVIVSQYSASVSSGKLVTLGNGGKNRLGHGDVEDKKNFYFGRRFEG